jgi:hypothetical protein
LKEGVLVDFGLAEVRQPLQTHITQKKLILLVSTASRIRVHKYMPLRAPNLCSPKPNPFQLLFQESPAQWAISWSPQSRLPTLEAREPCRHSWLSSTGSPFQVYFSDHKD